MWCDYQPHPFRFVWAFLIAGLVRTHTSLRVPVGSVRLLRLMAELGAADFIGFHIFTAVAARELYSCSGVVSAWLLSVGVAYPLRALVAQRAVRFLERPWERLLLDGRRDHVLRTARVQRRCAAGIAGAGAQFGS